jgi:DNA/RNA-binding domain of Phe-tRNA-synthetase-like protein
MNELQHGWCALEVQRELPELRVVSLPVSSSLRSLSGPPPAAVRVRLRELSNRWRGARAINVRQEPVPAAYRVFFRLVGLDPDVVRTPIEAAVLERMRDGGFLSRGALADVLTIAAVDTGVPVWALDSAALNGPLGVRCSGEDERLGGCPTGALLGAGQLVVADAERAVAVLFGEVSPEHFPATGTRDLMLFAVHVAGVPLLHIEEALWTARALLEGE